MKFLKYFVFLIAIFLFAQCDDSEMEETLCDDIECGEFGECIEGTCNCKEGYKGTYCEQKIGLLKSKTDSLHYVEEYKYDSENRLMEVQRLGIINDINELNYTRHYEYKSSDTILITTTDEDGNNVGWDTKQYLVNSNSITIEDIQNGGALHYITTIVYYDCGPVSEDYWDSSTNTGSTWHYEYLDDNCSYVITKTDQNGNFDGSIEVFIDGNKNTGIDNPLLDYQLELRGNRTQQTVTSANGSVDDFSSFETLITYNNDGYPSQIIYTRPSGIARRTIFQYY